MGKKGGDATSGDMMLTIIDELGHWEEKPDAGKTRAQMFSVSSANEALDVKGMSECEKSACRVTKLLFQPVLTVVRAVLFRLLQ